MMFQANDHTFVICAYKESQFLEECILSLKNQTVKTNIIMVSSTPNEYIKNLAIKYDISFIKNPNPSDIANDWNFALSQVKTPLATIAHQDDVYKQEYVEKIIQRMNDCKKPLIAFTRYSELRNGEEVVDNKLLKIKNILLSPIKIFSSSKWIRRRSLSMGNGICCPSVTYVLPNLPKPIFVKGMKSNIDWDAWERLSRLNGDFCYCDEVLMSHRIHEESTTTEVINETGRSSEDLEMFQKFWPSWIANLIESKYKDSEKQNDL